MAVAPAPSDEDGREAGDEQQRVQQCDAAGARHVFDRQPGQEGDVARHEGQHARRQEAEQTSRERDGDTKGRGVLHVLS